MKAYTEDIDDDRRSEQRDKLLPEMNEGESIKLTDIISDQHFTQPPPRFTEASLVKTLEEHGIGRPSTYASTIKTLVDREYVTKEGRTLFPTDTGDVVSSFVEKVIIIIENIESF